MLADLRGKLTPGVPGAVYHQPRLGLVRKSALDQVRRSPAHYRQWLARPSEPTPAMQFGVAFHAALLEPETFHTRYEKLPADLNRRTKAGKAQYEALLATGRTLLSQPEVDAIGAMVRSVREHPIAGKLLVGGIAESTIVWQDDETGLDCMARPDYVVPEKRRAVDIKTTADAGFDGFRKSVANYRYHVQEALYRTGLAACDVPVDHFALVVVERVPPYAVAVYTLTPEAVEAGHAAVREDVDLLARCVETGEWPGYPAHIQSMDLPPWAA